MTAGDLTNKLSLDVGQQAYSNQILPLPNDLYLLSFTSGASQEWIKTYNINGLGVSTRVDSLNFDTGGAIYCLHIANDIYAIFYNQAVGNGVVRTYSIVNGVISAVIATHAFFTVTGCILRAYPLHIYGNVYAVVLQGVGQVFIRTLSISDDGTAISDVALAGDGLGQNALLDWMKTGNVYTLVRQSLVFGTVLEIWNISNTGTITLLSQTTINTALTSGDVCLFRISNSMYACTYLHTTNSNITVFSLSDDGLVLTIIGTINWLSRLLHPTSVKAFQDDIYIMGWGYGAGNGGVSTAHIGVGYATLIDTQVLDLGPASYTRIMNQYSRRTNYTYNRRLWIAFLSGQGSVRGKLCTYDVESIDNNFDLSYALSREGI